MLFGNVILYASRGRAQGIFGQAYRNDTGLSLVKAESLIRLYFNPLEIYKPSVLGPILC